MRKNLLLLIGLYVFIAGMNAQVTGTRATEGMAIFD